MKLGILTSHPIQYQAPLFRALAKEMEIIVYFAHRATPSDQAKAGFGVQFEWDTDLTSGYQSVFLKNESRRPGIDNFFGCNTPSMADHIRKEAFDAFVVMGWNFKSYWQAIRACRRLGIPIFARGDSNLSTPRAWGLQQIKRIIYPVLFSQLNGFLSVGSRSKEYLKYYGVPDSHIFHVPHFVENEWFEEKSLIGLLERTKFRNSIGVGSETYLALFVGKLIPEKRPSDLLEAVFVLVRQGVDIAALFVGAGHLEPSIRRQAEFLKIRAHMVGFKNQTELPYYYGVSDCLVLPSASETWGLVVNEAMACGLPAVVSTAVGCCDDLIESGRTGSVYEVGKVEQLARSIQSLRHLLGKADLKQAIRNTISRYSAEEAVKGIRQALTQISLILQDKTR